MGSRAISRRELPRRAASLQFLPCAALCLALLCFAPAATFRAEGKRPPKYESAKKQAATRNAPHDARILDAAHGTGFAVIADFVRIKVFGGAAPERIHPPDADRWTALAGACLPTCAEGSRSEDCCASGGLRLIERNDTDASAPVTLEVESLGLRRLFPSLKDTNEEDHLTVRRRAAAAGLALLADDKTETENCSLYSVMSARF